MPSSPAASACPRPGAATCRLTWSSSPAASSASPRVRESGEAEVLGVLAGLFDDRYEIRTPDDADGALRAVAVVPADPVGPLLVFTGHVDVVPTATPTSGVPADLRRPRRRARPRARHHRHEGGVAAIVAALDGAPCGSAVGALFTVEEETGSRGAAEAATLLDGLDTGLLVVAEPTDGRVVRGTVA